MSHFDPIAAYESMCSELDKASKDAERLRYCPICYCAVPRATYHSEHMPGHGYEVLNVEDANSPAPK